MSQHLIKRTTSLMGTSLDYILVDSSGSMHEKWYDLVSALDLFVDTLKTSNVNSHGIVMKFNYPQTIGDEVVLDSPLREWPRIGSVIGQPSGLTALYDAINFMCRELAEYDPPKCSIVIVSDGMDGDSKYTNAPEAKAMLDWCRAQGWQVTFIGWDFDNTAMGKLLGFDDENVVSVRKQLASEAGKTLGQKRIRYENGGDMGFDADERKKFGGFLSGPSGN